MKPKVFIRNEYLSDEGYRYGCEIQAMNKSEFRLLRGFILAMQLANEGGYLH